MKIRLTAGAILTCGDKVLMLHRGMHKELAPGKWSGVGGHMEPEEMNDPRATCLREIKEETGITPEQIRDLQFRYIVMSDRGDEVHTIYYFTGSLESELPLPETDEGTLHWVDKYRIPQLDMSYSSKNLFTHWLINEQSERVMVLTVNESIKKANWTEL